MTNKQRILKFKDYVDLADASYALLHWITENEDDDFFDSFKTNPPARWKFYDTIQIGDSITKEHLDNDELKDILKANNRKLGEPTAYALSIEARAERLL